MVNNVIHVYQPAGEKAVHPVQTIDNLYTSVQGKAPGSPALNLNNFRLIGLYPVDKNESRSGIMLIAATENGVRLYFSQPAAPSSYYPGPNVNAARDHRKIELVHIRLPPSNLLHPDEQAKGARPTAIGYGPQYNPQEPAPRPFVVAQLERVMYTAGLTIAAQEGDSGDGKDFLLCMAPDLPKMGSMGHATQQYANAPYGAGTGPQRPPLVERAAMINIPGRTWALAAVPRPRTAFAATIGAPNVPTAPMTNELAYQFLEPSRQFMAVTNEGMTIIAKRRPLDWLREALEESQADGNIQSLVEFRDR